MLLLGLTGSIATGKSTVSKLLSSPPYNLPVIDADVLAREVVEPGTPGYRAVLSHFLITTPGLVASPGAPLDRAVLGRRVFGNTPERVRDRKVLNGIIHPLVKRAVYSRIVHAYLRGAWAVVLDVPLLFEAGMEAICGGVIIVGVDEETQLRRLLARDSGLSEEDARRRVRSQWGVREKTELARFVFGDRAWEVDNSGNLGQLAREVERVLGVVGRRRKGFWKWIWGLPPVVVLLGLIRVVRNVWRRKEWERRKKAKEAAGKARL